MADAGALSAEDVTRAESEANTFGETLAGRRIGKVMGSMFELHGALMETLDWIAFSDAGDKPKLVKAAIGAYVKKLKAETDAIVADAFKKSEAVAIVKAEDAARAVLATFVKAVGEIPMPTKKTPAFTLDRITDEATRKLVAAELERRDAATAELTTKVAALEKKAAHADPEPSIDDVLKDASPEMAKLVKGLSAQVATLTANAKTSDDAVKKAQGEATAERIKREDREAITKAEGDFSRITCDFTALGPVLRKLDAGESLTTDEVAVVRDTLAKANEQIDHAALFGAKGHERPTEPTDVEAKVEKAADKLMESDATLTREQAIDTVYSQHPQWYAEDMPASQRA